MWYSKWNKAIEGDEPPRLSAHISCFPQLLDEDKAEGLVTSFPLAMRGIREAEYFEHEARMLGLLRDLSQGFSTAMYVHATRPENPGLTENALGGWVHPASVDAGAALAQASVREIMFADVAVDGLDLLLVANFDLLIGVHGQVQPELRRIVENRHLHLVTSE